MDWMQLLATVMEALIPVVIAAIGVVLLRWLKQKGVKEEYTALIEEAWSLLSTCVLATNQSLVDDMKKANGGVLTEEQKEHARARTIASFKQLASDALQLAIEAAYGSMDAWLNIALEADVKIAKE